MQSTAKEGQVTMTPNVTMQDVARAAGVHTGTVSRALNEATRDRVSADTLRRIDKAVRDLGYVPNPIARSLRTATSNTVGVVIPDLTNPLFPPMIRGIQSVLDSRGFSPLIVSTDYDPQREAAAISALLARQVDGLIVATARLNDPTFERLADQGTRIVMINRRMGGRDLDSVTADDETGMGLVISHLAELGHERILCLAGPQDTSTGVARLRGFRSAVESHGLDRDQKLIRICESWTTEQGAIQLASALDENIPFTAVVAATDLIALGCYDAMAERGLSCPADLSVAGYNDMPLMDRLAPPLTSVAVPQFDIGREGARLFLAGMDDSERLPRTILLPVSLSIRGSTAPPV